jgi:uncharacterized protein YlzI (FlbEa/FlbD family)
LLKVTAGPADDPSHGCVVSTAVGGVAVIVLHNVHGAAFAINAGLIERIEGDTETHVMLVTGTNYVVLESLEQVVALHREDRARVQALAGLQLAQETSGGEQTAANLPLRLVEPGPHQEWGNES